LTGELLTRNGCDRHELAVRVYPESRCNSGLVSSTGQPKDGLSWNGLSWNGLSRNRLSWNRLSWNRLSWNGLSWNGLSWKGLKGGTLILPGKLSGELRRTRAGLSGRKLSALLGSRRH